MALTLENNVLTILAASVAQGDTSIDVNKSSAPYADVPNPGSGTAYLTLTDSRGNPSKIEIIQYGSRTDNGDGTYTLGSVSKGQQNTTDQSFSSGDIVLQTVTASDMGEAAAKGVTGADTNAVTGTAGTSGNVVQWNADGDATDSGTAASDIVTPSSTDTFTNKTFDANGTGNSLSNIETGNFAAAALSGADTTVITGTAGTGGNLAEWNADGDVIDTGIATSNVVTPSSTDTFTNKTFDANGTGNSLSNIETGNFAASALSGADTTVITGTAGTSGNVLEWNADGDAVDAGVATTDIVTPSSTDTLTNKTFDANGTGNSLSNVETADLASGAKTGADTQVVTGTAGTSGNFAQWNADGDAVDSGNSASDFASASHTHTLSDITDSGTLAAQDAVTPTDLDATDSPNDGEFPSYNSSQGQFEWVSAGGGGDDLSALPSNIIGQTSSNQTLDLSANTVFEIEPTADITINLTGFASAGSRAIGYLTLINGGNNTLSFGSEIQWSNESVPSFSKQFEAFFKLGTASYDNTSLDASSEDGFPSGIAFKSDGTKMYMAGIGNDNIYQYTLSTPWDLGTASYDNTSFAVGSQDGTPQEIAFKSDGTKMYMVGTSHGSVYQYTLSTPWDLSSASYDNTSFSVSEDSSPESVAFKKDGAKMYIVGNNNDSIYQYTLSTPWDLGTASYDNTSFAVGSEGDTPKGIAFASDGTKMYMAGRSNKAVYQYSGSSGGTIADAADVIHIAQINGTSVAAASIMKSGVKAE